MKSRIYFIVLLLAFSSLAYGQERQELIGNWTYERHDYKVLVSYSGSGPTKNFKSIKIGNKTLGEYIKDNEDLKKKVNNLEKQIKNSVKDPEQARKVERLNKQVDSLSSLVSAKDNEYLQLNETLSYRTDSLNLQIQGLRGQIDELKSVETAVDPSTKELKKTLAEKEKELRQLRSQLEKQKEKCAEDMKRLEKQKQELQTRLDDVVANSGDDTKACQEQLTKARMDLENARRQYTRMEDMELSIMKELKLRPQADQDTLRLILSKIQEMQQSSPVALSQPQNRDYLSLDAGVGRSFLYSSQFPLGDGTSDKPSWSVRATYSHYLSSKVPLAFTVGVALKKTSFNLAMNDTTIVVRGYKDVDKDKCDVYCAYTGVHEKMSMTYLDIPIALTYGTTFENSGIQGWVKVGVVASFNIGCDYAGSRGSFTTKGHYNTINGQSVDMWIEDVPSLGYGSDQPLFPQGAEPYTMNTLMILGDLEAGVYIPVGAKTGFTLGAYLTHSLFPSVMNIQENEYQPNLSHHYIFEDEKAKMMSCGIHVGFKLCL